MTRRPLLHSLTLLLVVAFAGCGEQDLTAPAEPEADRIHGLIGSAPQPAVVGRPVSNVPAVVARGSDGRPVPGILVRFEVTAGGGSAWPAEPIETDAYGVARLDGWSMGSETGENELVATLVEGSGATAVFRAIAVAGEASPEHTTLGADPRLNLPADGEGEAVLTLRMQDAFGNPVQGRSMYLWVLEGPEDAVILGERKLVTGADGAATTTLRSLEPGLVRLGVFGEDHPDGPEFGGATAIFVPGVADGSRSVITASPVRGIVADGESATRVRVLVRDAAGNPRDDVQDLVLTTERGELTAPEPTDEPGVYVAELRSRTAGWTRVAAHLDSGGLNGTARVEIGGTQVEFVAGPTDPGESSVEPAGDGPAVVGAPSDVDGALVVVTLRDAFGNLRLDGEDRVEFEAESGELGEVVWLGDGRYGVRVYSTTSGPVRVTAFAEADGRRTQIGQATARFGAAAPDPVQSTIEVDDSAGPVANGQDAAPVTVVLRDAHGNALGHSPHRVVLSSGSGAASSPDQSLSGRFRGELTSTVAGSVEVTAHLQTDAGGVEIGSGTATFLPGPPAALEIDQPEVFDGQTGTVAEPLPLAARVRVIDAFANPVSGAKVHFTAGAGSLDAPAPVVTGADGIAEAPVWTLGTTAGVQTLAAHLGGPTGPSVTIEANALAGPPHELLMHEPAETDQQEGTIGYPVPVAPRVLVRDEYGNPVPDASVSFAVASGDGTGSGSTTTAPSGVATIETWYLGSTEGANSLLVESPTLPGEQVTFEATASIPAFLDWQNWSASGSTAGVSEPAVNAVRLEYAQMSGYSGSWTYTATSDRTETLRLDWDLRYCHSFFQAAGTFRIEADGPDGTQSIVIRNGGGCYFSGGGAVELDLHEGYAVRFRATGSHFDAREELSGRLDLSLAPPS